MSNATEVALFEGDHAVWASSPIVERLLPTLDGYKDLLATARRIEESAKYEPQALGETGGFYADRAVERVLEGESIEDMARLLITAEDEQRLISHMEGLRRSVVNHARARANGWLESNRSALVAAIDSELQGIVEEATELCSVPLRGAHAVEEIVRRPELLEPFQRLTELAERFGEIERTIRAIVGQQILGETGPTVGRPWVLSHIIRDYEAAWPKFWLSMSLTIQDRAGNTYGTIDAEHSPIDPIQNRPLDMLRYIAERNVEVWVPVGQQALRAHRLNIDKLWEQRRDEAVAEDLRRSRRG